MKKYFVNSVASSNKTFNEKSTFVFPDNKLYQSCTKPLQDLYVGFQRRARGIRIHKYKASLPPARQAVLQNKLLASDNFKDKKSAYASTVPLPFTGVYNSLSAAKDKVPSSAKYVGRIKMVDTKSFGTDDLWMVITPESLMFYDVKKLKLLPKEAVPCNTITAAVATTKSDGLLQLKCNDADVVIECLEPTGAIEVTICLLSLNIAKNVTFNDKYVMVMVIS